MKEIRVVLEDKEYRQMKHLKGGLTWKAYLIRELNEVDEDAGKGKDNKASIY